MIPRLASLLLAIALAAPAQAEELRIPVLVPLTGVLALEGTSQRNGALLAIAQPPPGVTAKAEVADTGAAPELAVTALEKALDPGIPVAVVASMFGPQILAMLPIGAERKVPLLTISGSVAVTEQNNPWVFRIAPDSQMQADAFAKYLPEFHVKKAAFLVVNNDWGLGNYKTFADLLEKNHVSIISKELMSPSDQDMSAQLSKIKASGADSLFIVTEVEQLALVLKQARTMQLPQKMISASASSSPDQIIEEAGPAASDGVYSIVCFTPWFSDNWPNPNLAKAFVTEWKKRGYVFAGITEGFRGYDGIQVIAAAIKKAGKADPKAIQQAFWQVQVPGVNATYKFAKVGGAGEDDSAQSNANVYLIEMKGGKVVEPTF